MRLKSRISISRSKLYGSGQRQCISLLDDLATWVLSSPEHHKLFVHRILSHGTHSFISHLSWCQRERSDATSYSGFAYELHEVSINSHDLHARSLACLQEQI